MTPSVLFRWLIVQISSTLIKLKPWFASKFIRFKMKRVLVWSLARPIARSTKLKLQTYRGWLKRMTYLKLREVKKKSSGQSSVSLRSNRTLRRLIYLKCQTGGTPWSWTSMKPWYITVRLDNIKSKRSSAKNSCKKISEHPLKMRWQNLSH